MTCYEAKGFSPTGERHTLVKGAQRASVAFPAVHRDSLEEPSPEWPLELREMFAGLSNRLYHLL